MSPTARTGPLGVLSDTGAMLFRDSLGNVQGLPVGAAAQVLTVAGGLPSWAAVTGNLNGYVFVQQKSDFPAPVGGVIQLADNTIYQINGFIPLGTDRLVMGDNTVVTGAHREHDGLTYTGTDALVSASGGDSLVLKNLLVIANTGAVVDAVDCPLLLVDGVVGTAESFGTADECDRVVVQQGSITELTSGLLLSNTSAGSILAILNQRLGQKFGETGILLDLGTGGGASVWDSIQITITQLDSAVGGTDLRGDSTANGNLTATTGRGRVFDAIINGLGTHLDGITVDDVQWNFTDNIGIQNSVNVGGIEMAGNSADTTISTQNVFVKAAGTTVLAEARRFDAGASPIDNNLRVTGLTPITCQITVEADLIKTGAEKDFQIQVFKNGSAIGVPSNIPVANKIVGRGLVAVEDADTDDLFDLRVANTTDTDDVTVVNLTMTIIGL